MNRILFFFLFILFISACGSANDFIDDIEGVNNIDSILIIPPSPQDSTTNNSTDSIVIRNDTTIIPKDSILVKNDSISSDSLSIKERTEIEFSKLFRLNSISKNSSQGFAIYGNLLFNCHHTNDVIDVFNLETKKIVSSIQLEPETIVHCNNVNFGSEFYDKEDIFPLLYIQQRGYACKLNVYRIICEGDSILTAKKVQTISFKPCSWCINAIDTKNSLLYAIYGYNGKNYISSFRLPSVHEGDVTIHPGSAYKSYYNIYQRVGQDTAFDDKYLYIICGYSGEGQLWRIDLENKVAKVIDLTKYGLNGEPEGIDIYNGDIMVSFLNAPLYRIKILDN